MTQNARPRYGTPRWVKWFAGIVVVLIAIVVVAAIFAETERADDDVPAAPAVATSEPESFGDAQKRCGASELVPMWSNGAFQCVDERRVGTTSVPESFEDAQKRCGASGLVPRWSSEGYQCVEERRSQPRQNHCGGAIAAVESRIRASEALSRDVKNSASVSCLETASNGARGVVTFRGQELLKWVWEKDTGRVTLY